MPQAGSGAWFAQHETRLAWRDWAWRLSGGRRRRRYAVILGLVAFVVFTHGFAYVTLASLGSFAGPAETPLLAGIGGRRRRRYAVILGLVAFVVFTHGFAYVTLA